MQIPSLIAQLVKNLPGMQENPFPFLGREDPLEKGRLPTPVFLGFSCGSAGKESACNAETWVWSLGWEDPLEKRRLPTLVFRPGEFYGLYSLWGHRVRRDWATFTSLHLTIINGPFLFDFFYSLRNKIDLSILLTYANSTCICKIAGKG